jgi:hypothetical protein
MEVVVMETDINVLTLIMDVLNGGALVATVVLFVIGKIQSKNTVDITLEHAQNSTLKLAQEIKDDIKIAVKEGVIEGVIEGMREHNGTS